MVIVADGDDELVSPWALEVFNAVYQLKKADMVYSDSIQVNHREKNFTRGWSRYYPKYAI